MAERKATNKYYPPQWTPDQGSLNTFHGSHPLRERARKIKQGIIGVRFELPYNIWCGGCGEHLGMGVRYNAEKSRVGNYYSTPIFKFRMKCHLCDNYFEIQTDPKNCDYVVSSGASRKNERWEHKEGETASVEGQSEKQKLATDPMYHLEHAAQDEKKGGEDASRLHNLQKLQDDKKDDYLLNQLMRKRFREKKREIKLREEKDRELQKRASISIPLVPESEEDSSAAKRVAFSSQSAGVHGSIVRRQIRSQPLMGSSAGTPHDQLVKTCLRLDSGIFRRRELSQSSSPSSKGSLSQLRTLLGVQTKRL